MIINKFQQKDYFSSKFSDKLRANIINLPPEDVCNIKLNHAYIRKNFDIGIFGNSRSININAKSLDLNNQSFFNFSIPGQSFRNSIGMIKELSNKNKLPQKIIISFDFFELGLPGGNKICSNSFIDRFSDIVRDLNYLQKKKLYYDSLILLYHHIFTELENLKYKISIIRNKTFFKLFFGSVNNKNILIYKDGSYQEKNLNKKKNYIFNFVREDKYILIEKDFEQLIDLVKKKNDLIIYVSPIEPSILSRKNFKLSENAIFVKDEFYKLCKKYNILCFDNIFLSNKNEPFWTDSTHPPAERIGKWLSKKINNAI